MVLDNASDSKGSESFEDSAPSSDRDPYSTDSDSHSVQLQIDANNLPRPLPILGPLFGYNNQLLSKVLHKKIETATKSVKRPITQEEAQAFAYWTAKQISILSYGQPIGIAAGLWRCYVTAPKFQFPLYKPNLTTFRSDIFPPGLGTLKGPRAIIAWHAVRFLAYGAAGNWMGQIFTGSYAMSVAAVGELSDKRLAEYVTVIKREVRQRAGAISQNRSESGQPMPQGQEASGRLGGDDASPTVGAWEEEEQTSNIVQGTVRDNVPVESPTTSWTPRRQAPSQKNVPEHEDQPFGAWIDPSPTGGQGLDADTTSSPNGSAWERLRRGEKPIPRATIPSRGNQKSSQGTWSNQKNEALTARMEGSPTGESFAFSKTEQERVIAKEEAQKEFDARVEQERRGGDFSQENGDQKRW